MMPYFQDKTCLIVTKHQKELVIAPILKAELGLNCVLNEAIDTDSLGTFTGEIERLKDPLSTVKDKCMLGMHLSNIDFILANEGSFGPHPFIPFVKAGEEYMAMYDIAEQAFIVEKMLFFDTNFASETIKSMGQLDTVLTKLKFPTHGVILRSTSGILKNIQSLDLIRNHVAALIKTDGQCQIETDMRAMYNPTRMQSIGQLTYKLVDTISSLCEACGWHGFAAIEHVEGLCCSLCNRPTKSTLYQLFKCKKCGFEKKNWYPNNKHQEDPTYCDWCNP